MVRPQHDAPLRFVPSLKTAGCVSLRGCERQSCFAGMSAHDDCCIESGDYTACIQFASARSDANRAARRCLVTPFTYLVPGSPSAKDWSRSAAPAASKVFSVRCFLGESLKGYSSGTLAIL